MLKSRWARYRGYHESVEQLVAKIPAVELVAELIEVLLQELGLDAVVYVPHQ